MGEDPRLFRTRDEEAFARAMARLVDANPFLPERIEGPAEEAALIAGQIAPKDSADFYNRGFDQLGTEVLQEHHTELVAAVLASGPWSWRGA